MTSLQALEKAIEIAGNRSKLAEQIGIEKPQSVSNWVNRDKKASAKYVAKISEVTGVPCYELRPDIFPVPANECDAQSTQSA